MGAWDKEIAIAAKYWADFLRSSERPSRDNGDMTDWAQRPEMREVASLLGEKADVYIDMLTHRGAMVPRFTPEQVDLFEYKLRRVLYWACFFKRGANVNRNYLMPESYALVVKVDYHPDDWLNLAGLYADLLDDKTDNLSPYLPWKTTMWINRGSVRVNEGYNGDTFELFVDD